MINELRDAIYARAVGDSSFRTLISTTYTIRGAVADTPTNGKVRVETNAAHGRIAGDLIYISGVNGMTSLNSSFTIVTVSDTTHFDITLDTDQTWTSGGTIYLPRFYYMEAPESAAYPYAVFFEVSNIPSRDTVNKFEKYPVQISIYHNTTNPVNLGNIEEAIMSRFDDCESSLSLTSYHVIRVNRNFIRTIPTGDSKLRQIIYQMTIELQKK